MNYELHKTIQRPILKDSIVNEHLEFLKEKFYQVDTKWPQFHLLFDEINYINNTVENDKTILILERAYFYGGYSLFAPLFPKFNVFAVDCCIDEPGERWGKQLPWLEDSRCIKWRPNGKSSISELSCVETSSVDFIFVPNVIHHEREQQRMFGEFSRVLKPEGCCSIFEGLVRELHHLPDDYVRYTYEGLRVMFEKSSMELRDYVHGTGVFDVIAYVWQQALEYFPNEERKEKTRWFYNEHYPFLQDLDKKYKKNIVNPEKSFPMSYVVRAYK